jgi:hypothetical protein
MVTKIIIGVVVVIAFSVFAYKIDNPSKNKQETED